MTLKRKKVKKLRLSEFSVANNSVPGGGVDSLWGRLTSKKIDKQPSAELIKKKLGIVDEPHQDITAKSPLKMMDIVLQTWGDQLPGDPQQDPVAAEYDEDEQDDDEGDD